MINLMQLDSRNTPEAKASNDAILNGPVIGVEITDPNLAARCSLGNIDHYIDVLGINHAAIKAAWYLNKKFPENFTIAILKPDCDSIGAITIISKNLKYSFNHFNKTVDDRVNLISKTDCFVKDPVWHPQELPTRENPWPDGGGVESSRELAPLQAMCSDFRMPLEDRVDAMSNWLNGGDLGAGQWETNKYQNRVEKERQNLIDSLVSGGIKLEAYSKNKEGDFHFSWSNAKKYDGGVNKGHDLVLIRSQHRAATRIGYAIAPVVIAENDQFQPRPDQPSYRKLTICTWDGRYADIPAVCRELAKLELGWGSHQPNICGSPQGKSSELSLETIVEVVQRHLKPQR